MFAETQMSTSPWPDRWEPPSGDVPSEEKREGTTQKLPSRHSREQGEPPVRPAYIDGWRDYFTHF